MGSRFIRGSPLSQSPVPLFSGVVVSSGSLACCTGLRGWRQEAKYGNLAWTRVSLPTRIVPQVPENTRSRVGFAWEISSKKRSSKPNYR